MAALTKFKKSTIGRCFSVLEKNDQKKIFLVTLIQIISSLMDLFGVALIGVLGALAVSGVESGKPGGRIRGVIKFMHLTNMSFQTQVGLVGLLATFVLVGRTAFSIIFSRRTLYFLSRRGAKISSELTSQLLGRSLLFIQSRTTQETLYAITTGVTAVTLGVLGTAVMMIADLSLLIVMAIGLLLLDPSIAISTIALFSIIGFSMYRMMNVRARTLGILNSDLTIKSAEKISEVLTAYRESVVRNRREFYARTIGITRMEIADTLAAMQFMPNVSKYVIETSVILGAVVVGGIQFLTKDAVHAVGTLSVFLAAGTRIAPAVMRIQQGAIQVRSSLGSAGPTLDLIQDLKPNKPIVIQKDELDLEHNGFEPTVELQNVSFTYPERNQPAVRNLNLSIAAGQSIAIVGPSGAGKTTLVDILLGVIAPDAGEVKISGASPLLAVEKWPGAVAYVPQDVTISNGTFRENVALGYPPDVSEDYLVRAALEKAHLESLIESFPGGMDTPVGERGAKLSGGQRQRLGIARAFFTNPRLLVLDEATSALDSETEGAIAESIRTLKGEVTTILIAHRLSSVRFVDKVVYMSEGQIIAMGSFEEVKSRIPEFEKQARLLGL